MSDRPLKRVRNDADLTLEETIRLAKIAEPRFPLTTYQALIRVEREGTENYWVLKGLALVYRTDLDRLARLADPKKCNEVFVSA